MNTKKLIATTATMLAAFSLSTPAWAATARKPARKPVPVWDTKANLCYGRENLAAVSANSSIQYGLAWLSPTSDWHDLVLAVPWQYVMCTGGGRFVVSSLTQPFVVRWTVKDIAKQPVLVALLAGPQGGNGFGKVLAHAHWTRVLPGHVAKLTETTDYEQGFIDGYFVAVRPTVPPQAWAGYTMWVWDNFDVTLRHGIRR